MSLYIHPASQKRIDSLVAKLPQSLLLSGPEGIGLSVIAEDISSRQAVTPLVVLPERDEKVDIEKGTITVDSIRRLHSQTRSKLSARRFIVIDYVERMTHQAQNAFLKLLEEPNEYIHFILLSHKPEVLLPTIRSRVQHVELRRITREQSEALLDELQVTNPTKRQQLLYIAEGLPAELTRLVGDDEYFVARAAILRDARSLLRETPYNKLLIAHRYVDKRTDTLTLLGDASALLRRSLAGKAAVDASIIRKLDAAEEAYARVAANGNIRLVLAAFVV